MNVLVWLAAAVSAVTFYVHTFVGGPRVATPLLANRTLPAASKWLNYYCWHITTVMLAFFVAGFTWLASHPHLPSLVWLSALSLALSVLSGVVARLGQIPPWRFPSTSLFAGIGVAGGLAVLSASA